MKLKHFTIFDIIFSAIVLSILFGLGKLSHNCFKLGEYVWSGLFILCLFGLIWLVYGWIKEGEKETKKQYRKARW